MERLVGAVKSENAGSTLTLPSIFTGGWLTVVLLSLKTKRTSVKPLMNIAVPLTPFQPKGELSL